MLIVLIGPSCSGKDSIAQYLVQRLHFQRLSVASPCDHCASSDTFPDPSTLTLDDKNISGHASLIRDSNNVLRFKDHDELLIYATKYWTDRMVISDLRDSKSLTAVLRRPWALLVGIEAPVYLRWERYKSRMDAKNNTDDMSLEKFIRCDDEDMYGRKREFHVKNHRNSSSRTAPSVHWPADYIAPPPVGSSTSPPDSNGRVLSSSSSLNGDTHDTNPTTIGLSKLIRQSHIILSNNFKTLDLLHHRLEQINFIGKETTDRLRPTWDEYFMCLSNLASLRSNCMKRRVGAVLVSPTYRVISTGYNGTPRGVTNCNEGGCARCNGADVMGAALDECLCLHAEENALLEAGRERAGAGEGGRLYCNTCPCLRCTVKIVQVGVKEVVYSLSYSMDTKAANIFKEAGVILRQIDSVEREM